MGTLLAVTGWVLGILSVLRIAFHERGVPSHGESPGIHVPKARCLFFSGTCLLGSGELTTPRPSPTYKQSPSQEDSSGAQIPQSIMNII